MRYGVGLLGLLITVALMFYFFTEHTTAVVKVGNQAHDQAQQIAGRDDAGNNATDALTLDTHERGGHMDGVLVTAITPGSNIDKLYGLQVSDIITKAGDTPFQDPFVSDAASAKDWLLRAYQANQKLDVTRSGQRIMLPLAPGSASVAPVTSAPATIPPTAVTPPPATPAQPPTSPEPAKDPLQRQLDLIKKQSGQE